MAGAAGSARRSDAGAAHRQASALSMLWWRGPLPLGQRRRPRRLVLQSMRRQGRHRGRWNWHGPAHARQGMGFQDRREGRGAAPGHRQQAPTARPTDRRRRAVLALQRRLHRLPVPRSGQREEDPPADLCGRCVALEVTSQATAALLGPPCSRVARTHRRG